MLWECQFIGTTLAICIDTMKLNLSTLVQKTPLVGMLILYFLMPDSTVMAQNLVVDGSPILFPRMSQADRDAITPQEGMVIFNTDCRALEGFALGTFTSDTLAGQFASDLGEEFLSITPPLDIQLESISLYLTVVCGGSTIEVIDDTPCGSPSIIGTSSSGGSPGWFTYTFNPSISLDEGSTYYVREGSGCVNALLGDVDPRFDNLLYDSSGPDCEAADGSNYAFRVNYKGWLKLH